MHLDEDLIFEHQINEKIKLIKVLQIFVNWVIFSSTRFTNNLTFIRSHLGYNDVIYDQPEDISLSNNIETVQ